VTDNPVCWTGTGSGGSITAFGPSRAYVDWIRRFVLHHNTPRHGGGGGRGVPDPPRGREGDVGLDAEPAKGAVLFLYKEVLGELCRGSKASSRRSGPSACRWS